MCSGAYKATKLDYLKSLGGRLALVNVFIKLEKHSLPVQLILQSVPGKGRPFLVKYVRVHGNIFSPQNLSNTF